MEKSQKKKEALAVPDGEKIIPVVNKYIRYFLRKALPVFLTRDWHPEKTTHFKKFGGRWPNHCIRGTKGAEFHPDLKLSKEMIIISKGIKADKDSYSAFDGYDSNDMPLMNLLKIFHVEFLYIAGLAMEYCVKYTALEALKSGFKVKILIDAIKGIDLKKGDCENAIREMVSNGAEKMTFKNLEK